MIPLTAVLRCTGEYNIHSTQSPSLLLTSYIIFKFKKIDFYNMTFPSLIRNPLINSHTRRLHTGKTF